MFTAWLDAQKALGLGVGSTIKEEFGGTRASSEESPESFKLVLWGKAQKFRTLSWRKEELNEEPEFSLTIMC